MPASQVPLHQPRQTGQTRRMGVPPAAVRLPSPPGQATQPGATHRADASSDTVVLVAGLVAPVAAFFLFIQGFAAVNQSDPDVGRATTLYVLALLFVAAAAAVGAAMGSNRGMRLGIACAGLPFGIMLAAMAEASYGLYGVGMFFLFGGGMWLFIGFLQVLFFGVAIASLVLLGTSGSRRAADVAASGGLALAGAFAWAAGHHLLTLERQAELAREAHDVPGAFVAVLAVLAFAAFVRRRGLRGP